MLISPGERLGYVGDRLRFEKSSPRWRIVGEEVVEEVDEEKKEIQNSAAAENRRTVSQPAQIKQSRERAQNTNLTRFGLVAYVLGARKGEGFIDFNKSILTAMGIGKVLPLLYSPPQLLSQTLLQDLSSDPSKGYKTLEIQHSP